MVTAVKKAFALLLCASFGWATPAPTGTSCHGGGSGASPTAVCTAAMAVTIGDVIFCVGAVGSNVTLSSISGTGATWTAVAGLKAFDTTNVEGILGGWGIATATGNLTPTMTFSGSNSFRGIYCADFNGVQGVTDGAIALDQAGSTAANGVKSGNITTTVNADLLLGGTLQTDGTTDAITAGTVSVAYAKLACNTDSGNNLCIEWGVQTTAAASTAADWTYGTSSRAASNILAVEAAASGGGATPGFSKRDKLSKFNEL